MQGLILFASFFFLLSPLSFCAQALGKNTDVTLAGGIAPPSLDDVLREAANDAGLADLLACGSDGGTLSVSDLLSQLVHAGDSELANKELFTGH